MKTDPEKKSSGDKFGIAFYTVGVILIIASIALLLARMMGVIIEVPSDVLMLLSGLFLLLLAFSNWKKNRIVAIVALICGICYFLTVLIVFLIY